MLTYQIRRHKDIVKQGSDSYLSKEHILRRQLEKTILQVGDKVKFKKPKNKPIFGYLFNIETDVNLVKWSKGVVPNCMEVIVEKRDRHTGIAYGSERVFTSPKQLAFVERGVV